MKTTLDLPDDLLIEAKAIAARRRTTLRAMVEHALRREIQPGENGAPTTDDDFIEYDEHGIPGLKRRGVIVTSEMISKMLDDEDTEVRPR